MVFQRTIWATRCSMPIKSESYDQDGWMSKSPLDTEDISDFTAQGFHDDNLDLESTPGLLSKGDMVRQEFGQLEGLG